MTEKEQNGVWAILCLAGLFPFLLWSSYVESKIWLWFAPISWPDMPITNWILITLIIASFRRVNCKLVDDTNYVNLFTGAILTPALILLLAYICKLILI